MDQLQIQLSQVLLMLQNNPKEFIAFNMPHMSGRYTFIAAFKSNVKEIWIIDSGATDHICITLLRMHDVHTCSPILISLPNGQQVKVTQIGSGHDGSMTYGFLFGGLYALSPTTDTTTKIPSTASNTSTSFTVSTTSYLTTLWHNRLGNYPPIQSPTTYTTPSPSIQSPTHPITKPASPTPKPSPTPIPTSSPQNNTEPTLINTPFTSPTLEPPLIPPPPSEPHSYFQASKDPRWQEAMNKKIKALDQNKTWEFTTLPPEKTAIGSKWVFRIKLNANGSIERFKARLVAQGCTQKEGIDYKETFALVAKMVTVRCLLSINIKNNWFIEQLDINNAFLHGDLNEEVYMKVPKGYPQTLHHNTVCKLTKSFYGLKLTNSQWFEKLTTFLIQLVFKQSYVDTSLFTITYNGTITSLLVYVDDILLISKDGNFIKEIKTKLHDKFNIKNLGPLHYYLGIDFLRNSTGLAMTQRKYALELLECANVLDIKLIATPMDTTIKLNDSDGYLLPDPSTYRTLVGKLLYLTITRPDLSFAAQALNQYSHSPRSSHYEALLRVLKYIKLCSGQGLFFPSQNTNHLTTYYDSD
ncbi:retrovirus-related pol polyprotein from transposon RE1 [Tanacetum coccineum]